MKSLFKICILGVVLLIIASTGIYDYSIARVSLQQEFEVTTSVNQIKSHRKLKPLLSIASDQLKIDTLSLKRNSPPTPPFQFNVAPPTLEPVKILDQEFNTNFPLENWERFDQKKTTTSEYYWGVVPRTIKGPSDNLWCAAGGKSGSINLLNYPSNIESWLVYGPVDLSAVNWANVGFKLSLEVNDSDDYFACLVSTDKSNFAGLKFTGSSTGWQSIVMNLSDPELFPKIGHIIGQPEVWFAWVFGSDSDDNIAEGAYLDDISIKTGKFNQFDNIKSFATPVFDPIGFTMNKDYYFIAIDELIFKCILSDGEFKPVCQPIETRVLQSGGLDYKDDYLWNADIKNKCIYKLTLNGSYSDLIKSPGTMPFGVAWQDQILWNGDSEKEWIYNWNGLTWTPKFQTPGGPGARPTGIVWAENHLWLAEETTCLIYQLDTQGKVISRFLSPAPKPQDLAYNDSCLWCVAGESIYLLREPMDLNIISVSTHNFPEINVCMNAKHANKPLQHLKQRQIKIWEETICQNILSFYAPQNSSSFVLALDNSTSMQEDTTKKMISAAINFINAMGEEDRAAAIRFAYKSKTICGLTSNKSELCPEIENIINVPKVDATYLYYALNEALELIQKSPSPKAVILFTDGKDSPTIVDSLAKPNVNDVIDKARKNNTNIYTIGFGKKIDPLILRQIADNSGGKFYDAEIDNIDSIFNDIASKYNDSYQFTYKTPSGLANDFERIIKTSVYDEHLYGIDTAKYNSPPTIIKIEIPALTEGPPKGCIPVPVHISNLGKKRITSARFDIYFDPGILEFDHLSQQGTVVENWMISRNSENGRVKIAIAGSTPISSAGGILLYIYFKVLGKNGDCSDIKCKDCTLNGNQKSINIVNGAFRVCNGFGLSGKIVYHSSDLPVEKIILNLTRPDGKKLSDTTTDNNGNFHFKDIPWGQLLLTPEYHDFGDAAITTNDAASIYKIINASDQTINGYQLIAADVTGDNLISDDDIVEINEYCVGNPTRFQRVANWTFIPDSFIPNNSNWTQAPRHYLYEPLLENLKEQNFKGLVYGDVDIDWEPLSTQLQKAPDSSPLLSYFNFNDLTRLDKNKARLKIQVQNMEAAQSFFLSFKYSAEAIKSIQMQVGEMLDDFMIRQNCEQGMFRIAGAGLNPVKGSGEFLVLNIELTDAAESKLDNSLMLTEIQLDEKQVLLDQNLDLMGQQVELPTTFGLSPNYPNPFNLSTIIKYQLPEKSQVKVEVFNTLGQTIKVLVDKEIEAGYHQLTWNAQDEMGRVVPSGIYLYRMQAGSFKTVKKMTLFK